MSSCNTVKFQFNLITYLWDTDTDLLYLPENPSVPVAKLNEDGDDIIFLKKKDKPSKNVFIS